MLALRLLRDRRRLTCPEDLTLSCNKRMNLIVIASLIAVVGVPSAAHAQWGGWGTSSARIQVTPRHTEVYVDGYLAGSVDDFDGSWQRLRVAPGEHVIELYLEGHKTIEQTILFAPGQSYRVRHAMEPLAAGEAPPARPAPRAAAPAQSASAPFDAFGNPIGRGPGPVPTTRNGAAIVIRVQPADASILVDGERWQTSGSDRLEIQVTPGEHRIEVQKDGYQPFETTVTVRPGQTTPLNVSLTKA